MKCSLIFINLVNLSFVVNVLFLISIFAMESESFFPKKFNQSINQEIFAAANVAISHY